MDIINFIRYIGALLLTLALLGGVVLAVRRFAPHLVAGGSPLLRGVKATDRRLRLVESLVLDPKRRAVLLAYDDAEAVVILGANAETPVFIRPDADAKPQAAPTPAARPPLPNNKTAKPRPQ